ncbi:MAG TPA: ABC transporter permease [Candidatus Angelobacter sp.]|nr:ABC transporter permease [Candidatus Angelobacter sp.]
MISILTLGIRELRLALRALLKNPSFMIAATLMLGLGTGINAALFGVLHSVVFQPLPAKHPEQLITLSQQASGGVSILDLEDFRAQSHSFQQIQAYRYSGFSFRDNSGTELITGAQVTPGYLSMLGEPPLLGRTYEEGQRDQDHVVVLSEALWKGRFAGKRDILGTMINLNGESYAVLGIMPQAVRLPYDDTQIWVPVPGNSPWKQNRGIHALSMLARLKPGVSLQDAQADLSLLTTRLAQMYPNEDGGRSVIVVRLQEAMVSGIRQKLYLLAFAVVFVYLIAASNVASLSLARASYRIREIAVRKALGATRARLIYQLMIENLVLAIFGSAVGWLLALWWVNLIVALAPEGLPRLHEIHLDYSVFLLLVAFTFVIAILLSVLNIFQFERSKLNEALGAGGRGSVGRYRQWLRNGLVGMETATAIMLLIGAGLVIRSFQKLYTVDLGFRSENRLTMRLSLPGSARARSAPETYRPIYEKVSSLPGVAAVGLVNVLPLQNSFDAEYFIEGRTAPDSHNSGEVRMVNEDYFKAMGMTLVSGRQFTAQDNEKSPHVVVINQKMARKWFSDKDPIGNHIRTLGAVDWMSIVGVVADMRDSAIETEAPIEFYLPYLQNTYPPAMWNVGLVVKTEKDPFTTLPAVKQAIQSTNRDITLSGIESLDQVISDSLRDRRLAMTLLAIFASLALILATYGIYALLAYSVLQRTREIGVRMALGASRWHILYHFTLQGMRIIVVSLLIGTTGAYMLCQILEGLLFGVRAADPLTFALANVLLLITAICAILLPAWRGAKLDPHDALRFE